MTAINESGTGVVNLRIEGLQALDKTLSQLPHNIQRNVIRRALRRAAKPIVTRAKQKYGSIERSGALAESVAAYGSKIPLRKKDGTPTAARIGIGPKRSNKKAIAKYYRHYYKKTATPSQLINGIRHGHLVEFGFSHEGGKSITPRHILANILQAKGTAAVRLFRTHLGREVDKEVVKLRLANERVRA
jgi:hypothetical protein